MPEGERAPAIGEAPDRAFSERISWRFSMMDQGGKGKCSLELLHHYEQHLNKYEKLTRCEAETKAHCHPCSAKKLSKIGKDRVTAKKLEIDTLHQLDFGTPCRLWGIWEGSIFHVIWLDEKHAFYTSS